MKFILDLDAACVLNGVNPNAPLPEKKNHYGLSDTEIEQMKTMTPKQKKKFLRKRK